MKVLSDGYNNNTLIIMEQLKQVFDKILTENVPYRNIIGTEMIKMDIAYSILFEDGTKRQHYKSFNIQVMKIEEQVW